jgi:hypothetical protein
MDAELNAALLEGDASRQVLEFPTDD